MLILPPEGRRRNLFSQGGHIWKGGKPGRTGTRRGRNEGEQLGIAGPEEYTWWQCQAIGLGWCDCVQGILVVGH